MVQNLQEMANGLAKNAEELTNNLKEQIGEYKDVDCDSLAKNLQEACKAAKNDGIIPQVTNEVYLAFQRSTENLVLSTIA